jgi:hypothetical protein
MPRTQKLSSPSSNDRTERAEKRALLSSPSSNGRTERAEKRALLRQLDEANKRIRILEEANRIMANNEQYMALEDMGTDFYQDRWNQEGCSRVAVFPTPTSCSLASVDDGYNFAFNSMPGVHGQRKMENGYYSQPIWLKGSGYTLVGLVGSRAEKNHLKERAGVDFTRLPFMTMLGPRAGDFYAVTLLVDMVNHKAELYHGGYGDVDPNQRVEPFRVWDNLPDKVWVAIAMKRCTRREAVLLPCTHWDVHELETA